MRRFIFSTLLFTTFMTLTAKAQDQKPVTPTTLHLHQAWGTNVEHTDFKLDPATLKWQSLGFQCNGETFYYQVELKISAYDQELFVRIGNAESIQNERYVARFSAAQFVNTGMKVWGPDCPEITLNGDSRSGIDFVLMR